MTLKRKVESIIYRKRLIIRRERIHYYLYHEQPWFILRKLHNIYTFVSLITSNVQQTEIQTNISKPWCCYTENNAWLCGNVRFISSVDQAIQNTPICFDYTLICLNVIFPTNFYKLSVELNLHSTSHQLTIDHREPNAHAGDAWSSMFYNYGTLFN